MDFSYLLKTRANVESFNVRFNIPLDVDISYCQEGDIKDQRLPHVVFFPLMSILEGGVRFPVDPLLLRTLSFYELSPDQCLPNFYRVINCVGHLNRLYGLSLTHHDINFLYAIQGSLKHGYYLQTQNTMFRLISCLLDSNKNSAGEYVTVSRNWLNGELTCRPFLARQVDIFFSRLLDIPKLCFSTPSLLWLHYYFMYTCIIIFYLLIYFQYLIDLYPISDCSFKKFQLGINLVQVWELNFILRPEIFMHYDGQLRASYLILGCVPSYTSYQDSLSTLTINSSLLSYLDVRMPRFLPCGLTSSEARHLGPRLV